MTIYDVVRKLIGGQIMPIGETNEDEKRFDRLKQTTELVILLLEDIHRVASCSHRGEYSIERSEKFANKFLDELGIK